MLGGSGASLQDYSFTAKVSKETSMFGTQLKTVCRRMIKMASVMGLALHLGVASATFAGICPNLPEVPVYLLDTNSTLYVLQPGVDVFASLGRVSGLAAREQLIGMDFRP